MERLHADPPKPLPYRGSDELDAIAGPDMDWRTTLDEQPGKSCQHILVLELARNDERKAFPGRLVDGGQYPELAPGARPRLDEIVGPDMSWIFGPQPDARAVVYPQPTAFSPALGTFNPPAPPDPLPPFMVRSALHRHYSRGREWLVVWRLRDAPGLVRKLSNSAAYDPRSTKRI